MGVLCADLNCESAEEPIEPGEGVCCANCARHFHSECFSVDMESTEIENLTEEEKKELSCTACKAMDAKDNCGHCKKKVNLEYVFCYRCFEKYHHTCCGVSKATQKGRTQTIREKWSCKWCKEKDKSGQSQTSQQGEDNEKTSNELTEKDMFESLCKEMKEVTASNQALKVKCEEALIQIEENKKYIKELEQKVDGCETRMNKMEKQDVKTQKENARRNQYSRSDNVILLGAPVQDESEIYDVVIKVAKEMGVRLQMNEISIAHQLYAKEGSIKPIIIQLVHKRKKDELLQASYDAKLASHQIFPEIKNDKMKLMMVQDTAPFYRNLIRKVKEKIKGAQFLEWRFKKDKVVILQINGNKKESVVEITHEEDLVLLDELLIQNRNQFTQNTTAGSSSRNGNSRPRN